MKQIKLVQCQILSSIAGAIGGSTDGLTSAPVAIDMRLIAEEGLGVWRGQHKGVECIVKGKGKVSTTSYSTLSSGSQSQAIEEQCRLVERLDAQQHNINTLKAVIAQLTAGQPQPSPPPMDAEDLGRD